MTGFFAKYPIIRYDVQKNGIPILARDLMQRAKVRDFFNNNYLIFDPYTIKDFETPEIIASKIYGSPSYFWIVLLVNQELDRYYDWPLSSRDLLATIRKRYSTATQDGVRYATQTTHHYEDNQGNPVDETTYKLIPDTQRTLVTIYDWEVAQNEAKRKIRLLNKQFVQQIDKEMTTIMTAPVA